MRTADLLSLNVANDGTEEEEANVDINNKKGEDFRMGLSLICWDNAATMMDVSPPLFACCPPPHQGLLSSSGMT